jgi:hypothetical protein
MEQEVIFSGIVNKEKDAQVAGILGGLALICLVYFGVIYYFSETVPTGFWSAVPFVVVAAIVFGVWGIVKFRGSRNHLEILRTSGDTYSFLLSSPQKQVLIRFDSPFEIAYGWEKVYMPKVGHQKHLYLGFFKDGNCMLTLKYILGAIHNLPESWPQLSAVQTGRFQQPFGCNKMREIAAHFIARK